MQQKSKIRKIISLSDIEAAHIVTIGQLNRLFGSNILKRIFFTQSLKQHLEYCLTALRRFDKETEWMRTTPIFAYSKQVDKEITEKFKEDMAHINALFEAGISTYIYARICLNLTKSLADALSFDEMNPTLKSKLSQLRKVGSYKFLQNLPDTRNTLVHAENARNLLSGSRTYDHPSLTVTIVSDIGATKEEHIQLVPFNVIQELLQYTDTLISIAADFWHEQHNLTLK